MSVLVARATGIVDAVDLDLMAAMRTGESVASVIPYSENYTLALDVATRFA